MDRSLDDAIVMLVPALIKARAPDRSGRRIVEVSASTEAMDSDGDIVLQSALLDAADGFLESGVMDIDHYSEFGRRLGIPDPVAWTVGRPLEVKKLAGNVTSVVSELYPFPEADCFPEFARALAVPQYGMRRGVAAGGFWESLHREPPVVWYSSIFGYPTHFDDCSGNDGACGMMGATRFVIKGIDWRSLAFTRTPKNTALKGAARVVTAKSFIADFLAKGVLVPAGRGVPGMPMEAASLPGHERDDDARFRDINARLRELEQRRNPDGVERERSRSVQVLEPHHVGEAVAHMVEPTPAQAAAGNYPKGHVNVGGLDVAIETPMGAIRRGVGPDGTAWAVRMPADYGYVKRSEGADGDAVDVYLGMHCHRAHECPVWIVDQVDVSDPARPFDEHKAMVGFPDGESARRTYADAFSDGRGMERIGAVTAMSLPEFKEWLRHGDTTQPLAYRSDAAKARADNYPVKIEMDLTRWESFDRLLTFLRYVKDTANGGHGFKLEADRDDLGDKCPHVYIDGDGNDKIGSIRVNGADIDRVASRFDAAKALQQRPPEGAYPSSMADVWDKRECVGCGVHDYPSLVGYRQHFSKCCSYEDGMADVAAHAVMHRRHMLDNPFTAPPDLKPSGAV